LPSFCVCGNFVDGETDSQLLGNFTEGRGWLGVCVGSEGGNGLGSEALREGESDRRELWRGSDQRILVVQVVEFLDFQ